MKSRDPLLMIGASALVLALTTTTTAGTIRSPDAVIQNTAGDFSPFVGIGNTIDQSGLSTGFTSGVTDYDTYLAGNPLHDNAATSQEWATADGNPTGIVDYDLGASFLVERLAFWNDEFYGIASVAVFTSDDPAFTTSTPVGVFAPTDHPSGSAYSADNFDLIDTTARYVRFDLTAVSGHFTGLSRLSIGEVAFSTTVPEPTSLALLGLGGIALLRCRRGKGI